MSTAIVTGSGGLIGSEAVRFLHDKGYYVMGIDNDMRKYFFGDTASTQWNIQKNLQLKNYEHSNIDIRDREGLMQEFKRRGEVEVIIHTAAQPSHDWAAKEPFTDFDINAVGTLNMLESTRQIYPKAAFIFTSTNKVYGDTPNSLELSELETRYEITGGQLNGGFNGITEFMTLDNSKHSIFGASKVAADIMVQEYGKYFGMNTVAFRGGCLTGPNHSGANLHGFLSYLVKCIMSGKKYDIYGYKGKQVRDNIHAADVVDAFWEFIQKPTQGEAYNLGGCRKNSCSVLEAIELIRKISRKTPIYEIKEEARAGDHKWYISDMEKFNTAYPNFKIKHDLLDIIVEMIEAEKGKL